MIDNQTKPEVIAGGEYCERDIDSWFAIASARQLETFILCKKPYTRGNRCLENVKAIEAIERAQIALNIRLAEDAAKTVDKLIQHTEKLTTQTDIHIQHSEKLTQQTDVLVAESRKLGRLNWALIILTVGLLFLTAGLLWVDWHRDSQTITVSH
jgi:hypothetical protein